MTSARTLRIGGASGFWGDSRLGPAQLVTSGAIDVLVFDYLAETTMAVLAAARAKQPELGYATDFVDIAMAQVLPQVLARGIKVVSNAGGIHPAGCAAALRALAAGMGLSPRIAVVEGDDVLAAAPAGPGKVLSANAYLGAFPVARALEEGADIVITGRGVDSAVTLGPLIHAFGWTPTDHDKLAAGSLAGHIIECGCQATGGLFTDWDQVPDWPGMGYPIVEVAADGRFTLTKPAATGGLVRAAAVAEQLLYEIGDPSTYQLADVACDFRQVRIEQLDDDHVQVSGVRGRAPGGQYKVSATRLDGLRCAGMVVIVGRDAAAKARRTGEAILARTSAMLAQAGLAPWTATHLELLGCEHLYGPHGRCSDAREVMLRLVVDHPDKRAHAIFAREVAPAGTSWSPGTTMPAGGRPSPSPLIRPFSFLIDKDQVPVRVTLDGADVPVIVPRGGTLLPAEPLPDPVPWTDPPGEVQVEVPLAALAWARSGDKGDMSNIGVIARRPEWLPLLWDRLTPDVVLARFAHLAQGPVTRFHLPGIHAINFTIASALAGGGPASPRFDPLGKGFAQILLDVMVRVPESVAATAGV